VERHRIDFIQHTAYTNEFAIHLELDVWLMDLDWQDTPRTDWTVSGVPFTRIATWYLQDRAFDTRREKRAEDRNRKLRVGISWKRSERHDEGHCDGATGTSTSERAYMFRICQLLRTSMLLDWMDVEDSFATRNDTYAHTQSATSADPFRSMRY
jgi:hypothetical protein